MQLADAEPAPGVAHHEEEDRGEVGTDEFAVEPSSSPPSERITLTAATVATKPMIAARGSMRTNTTPAST